MTGRDAKHSNAPVSKPLCLIRLFAGLAHEPIGSLSDYPSTFEVLSPSALFSLSLSLPFVGELCANGSLTAIGQGLIRQWAITAALPSKNEIVERGRFFSLAVMLLLRLAHRGLQVHAQQLP